MAPTWSRTTSIAARVETSAFAGAYSLHNQTYALWQAISGRTGADLLAWAALRRFWASRVITPKVTSCLHTCVHPKLCSSIEGTSTYAFSNGSSFFWCLAGSVITSPGGLYRMGGAPQLMPAATSRRALGGAHHRGTFPGAP